MSGREGDETIKAEDWIASILPLLEAGQSLKIQPEGTSMAPFLLGGRDFAILSAEVNRPFQRADILLYKSAGGAFLLHRVHHVGRAGYYMLGDSHTEVEPPIAKDAVLAYATGLIRKDRQISCENKAYRALAGLWLLLRPLRPLIFQIRFSGLFTGRRGRLP